MPSYEGIIVNHIGEIEMKNYWITVFFMHDHINVVFCITPVDNNGFLLYQQNKRRHITLPMNRAATFFECLNRRGFAVKSSYNHFSYSYMNYEVIQ